MRPSNNLGLFGCTCTGSRMFRTVSGWTCARNKKQTRGTQSFSCDHTPRLTQSSSHRQYGGDAPTGVAAGDDPRLGLVHASRIATGLASIQYAGQPHLRLRNGSNSKCCITFRVRTLLLVSLVLGNRRQTAQRDRFVVLHGMGPPLGPARPPTGERAQLGSAVR